MVPANNCLFFFLSSFEGSLLAVFKHIDKWINSTDCDPQPTWKNFFRILKDTSSELDQLAYQIKEIFNGKLRTSLYSCIVNCFIDLITATDAVDDAAKLKADLVHLQGSSKSAEQMEKELESSVALCESILQKVQKANEERERLAMQLQSKEKEVTELSEQLNLFKQPGIC